MEQTALNEGTKVIVYNGRVLGWLRQGAVQEGELIGSEEALFWYLVLALRR